MSPSSIVLPSIETVGSPCSLDWVSSLEGLKTGGRLNTSFDGVRLLFRVSTHLLPILWSVGASSLTVPSKRIWIRGLEEARHWPISDWSFTVSWNRCLSSSHLVAYLDFGTTLPVFRSIISTVCLSGTRFSSYWSVNATLVTMVARSVGSFGSVVSWYSTFWPGWTTLPSTLSWSPPCEDSAITSFLTGGT